MIKGLEWYIKKSNKEEEEYKYSDLMTLMDKEFNIDLSNYNKWRETNHEVAKVYEKISKLKSWSAFKKFYNL